MTTPVGSESAREIVIEAPFPMTATRRRLAFEAVPSRDLAKTQAEAERRGVPEGREPRWDLRLGSGSYDLVWEWIEHGGIGEQS